MSNRSKFKNPIFWFYALYAAPALGIEPESLKRIEAPSSEIGPSLEVLCGAIELYEQDPNFYWEYWEENQKLLEGKKEEN